MKLEPGKFVFLPLNICLLIYSKLTETAFLCRMCLCSLIASHLHVIRETW